MTFRYCGTVCCIVGGVPRLCIRTTAPSSSAINVPSAGSSVKAEISLRSVAPALKAAFITAAFRVSTDRGTALRFRTASINGITRSSSSASQIYEEPGRVDSPPISIISAPSASKANTRSKPFCKPTERLGS